MLRRLAGGSLPRYLLVGGGLFLVDLAVFLLLKRAFGLPTPIAQGVSRTVGSVTGFAAHKFFTFRNRDTTVTGVATQGSGYVALTVFNILFSPLVVSGVEHLLPGNLVRIKFLAEIILVTETFLVLRFIFRR